MNQKACWVFLLLCLTAAAGVGCSCDDDDDDDDSSTADDDATDDDATDDDATDDDGTDDDATDDDATDDDATDDDTTDDDAVDDDDDTLLVAVDFEIYPLGPLGSPWIVEAIGPSTATIIDNPTAKDGSGHILEIDGATQLNESISGYYGFLAITEPFTAEFDFYFESGAVVMSAMANGAYNYPFDILVVDGEILPSDPAGPDFCDQLVAAQWHRIGFVVDPTTRTFTIQVDGADTDCVDLSFGESFTDDITQWMFLDIGNPDAGGIVYFDNLEIRSIP